ncbi:MAG: hypothetical protein NC911_05570 [Candidatus Omnitrophica bacterium]|nr:hypothetical protein [Candidatus Omnitrophota bacterium]
MITEISEPIKVASIFSCGKVKICWFVWKGRRVEVVKTTFAWKNRRGEKNLHHFALSNGQEVFEVSFCPEDLSWYLERVHLQ